MREYIVFSLLTIGGLVCLVISQNLGFSSKLSPYMEAIATTFLTGGVLGVLYKKFVDVAHYGEIKRLLGIHEAVEESGIIEYHRKVNEFNYAELINDSNELTVVFNDGLSWVKQYSDDLRNRFSRNTRTVIFKLGEDNSYLPALCNKVGYSVEDYISKLNTANTELINLYEESDKLGSLEIFDLNTYPTQALYLTEEVLVITPYQISSTRLNIPALVLRLKRGQAYYIISNMR